MKSENDNHVGGEANLFDIGYISGLHSFHSMDRNVSVNNWDIYDTRSGRIHTSPSFHLNAAHDNTCKESIVT